MAVQFCKKVFKLYSLVLNIAKALSTYQIKNQIWVLTVLVSNSYLIDVYQEAFVSASTLRTTFSIRSRSAGFISDV